MSTAKGKFVAPGTDKARDLARTALIFLAGEERALKLFLGETGLDPGELRSRADDPVFLGAVLDFVLSDDALTVAVAQAAGISPEQVAPARRHLPGAPTDW